MKTPRRLVQDTLEFQLGPSRIPRELWLLHWAGLIEDHNMICKFPLK